MDMDDEMEGAELCTFELELGEAQLSPHSFSKLKKGCEPDTYSIEWRTLGHKVATTKKTNQVDSEGRINFKEKLVLRCEMETDIETGRYLPFETLLLLNRIVENSNKLVGKVEIDLADVAETQLYIIKNAKKLSYCAEECYLNFSIAMKELKDYSLEGSRKISQHRSKEGSEFSHSMSRSLYSSYSRKEIISPRNRIRTIHQHENILHPFNTTQEHELSESMHQQYKLHIPKSPKTNKINQSETNDDKMKLIKEINEKNTKIQILEEDMKDMVIILENSSQDIIKLHEEIDKLKHINIEPPTDTIEESESAKEEQPEQDKKLQKVGSLKEITLQLHQNNENLKAEIQKMEQTDSKSDLLEESICRELLNKAEQLEESFKQKHHNNAEEKDNENDTEKIIIKNSVSPISDELEDKLFYLQNEVNNKNKQIINLTEELSRRQAEHQNPEKTSNNTENQQNNKKKTVENEKERNKTNLTTKKSLETELTQFKETNIALQNEKFKTDKQISELLKEIETKNTKIEEQNDQLKGKNIRELEENKVKKQTVNPYELKSEEHCKELTQEKSNNKGKTKQSDLKRIKALEAELSSVRENEFELTEKANRLEEEIRLKNSMIEDIIKKCLTDDKNMLIKENLDSEQFEMSIFNLPQIEGPYTEHYGKLKYLFLFELNRVIMLLNDRTLELDKVQEDNKLLRKQLYPNDSEVESEFEEEEKTQTNEETNKNESFIKTEPQVIAKDAAAMEKQIDNFDKANKETIRQIKELSINPVKNYDTIIV